MVNKREDRDALAQVLADSLNKKFKDYKVAHFLDGADETPTDLTEWISTGSSMLDIAIANRNNWIRSFRKVSSCCTNTGKYTKERWISSIYRY